MQLLAQLPGAIRETLECLSGDTCSPAVKGLRGPVAAVSHRQPCPGVLGNLSHLKWHWEDMNSAQRWDFILSQKHNRNIYKWAVCPISHQSVETWQDSAKSGVQGATQVTKWARQLRVRGTSKTSLILFREFHWQ